MASPSIHILPDALADQIAAGEVVERPASVVKELLENAGDAGANQITVEITAGGCARIRVSDDGHGMSPQDAALCVRRHATSKLHSGDELFRLATLGFRGEALPSIASVSRFTLTTRTRDAQAGTRVRIEGGSEPQLRQVGCAPGTIVEVEDLFYNVPARRKFLKARGTESGQVASALLRTSLAHPHIGFTLLREGRKAKEFLKGQCFGERVRATFPEETLSEISREQDGVAFTALLSPPERARGGATALHLFVNGRPVRDLSLARAVAFAYGSVLPPGRYPVGALQLTLDPAEVDVNVHPQKQEVRFARGRAVYDAVTRTLAKGLGTTAWGGPSARSPDYWNRRLGGGGGVAEALGARSTAHPLEAPQGAPTNGPDAATDPWGLASPANGQQAQAGQMGPSPPSSTPAAPGRAAAGATAALLPETGFFGSLRVLGQVRRMMLVCEGEGALHIIDQHAADERVRYDRLRRSYEAQEVQTQQLLFPERVECSDAESALVEAHREGLLRVGLECELLGPTTVAIRAVPALLVRAPPERLLRDVLGELGRQGERAFGDAVDMALATMACHGAIRAGDALSNQEASKLLSSMDAVEDFAAHCPHGRPVVVSLPFDDLERRLGR